MLRCLYSQIKYEVKIVVSFTWLLLLNSNGIRNSFALQCICPERNSVSNSLIHPEHEFCFILLFTFLCLSWAVLVVTPAILQTCTKIRMLIRKLWLSSKRNYFNDNAVEFKTFPICNMLYCALHLYKLHFIFLLFYLGSWI